MISAAILIVIFIIVNKNPTFPDVISSDEWNLPVNRGADPRPNKPFHNINRWNHSVFQEVGTITAIQNNVKTTDPRNPESKSISHG